MTGAMSPHAVTARLRMVSELRDVCMALGARRPPVGIDKHPVENSTPPTLGHETVNEAGPAYQADSDSR